MENATRGSLATPRLVVVAGSQGGVGTTTVALNLALALSREGRRAMLIDADARGADLASMCGLDAEYDLDDVLSGSRDLHEALVRGPAGVQVLPGAWGAEVSATALDRFLREIGGLGAYTEFVVVDAGSGLSASSPRWWQAADSVLLVATADDVAITDAYLLVKTQVAKGFQTSPKLLINRACEQTAVEVQARLERACQRFLGLRLTSAGHLPPDPNVPLAQGRRRPCLMEFPRTPVSLRMEELARSLVQSR